MLEHPLDYSKDEQHIKIISNLQPNIAKPFAGDDSKKEQKGLKIQMHATNNEFRKERLNQTEYMDDKTPKPQRVNFILKVGK